MSNSYNYWLLSVPYSLSIFQISAPNMVVYYMCNLVVSHPTIVSSLILKIHLTADLTGKRNMGYEGIGTGREY